MSRELIIENPLNGCPVDLVVGIPSYNEADSIAFVVQEVARGLEQNYPQLQTAIVNADNCSQDGTKTAFLKAPSGKIPKVYLSTPPGIQGKGNNLLNLFRYLLPHRCKAMVVVDADLRSITPDWPRRLADPVLDGYDFVAPLYKRNEYDGTITNHLCYPLIYSLLGKNIRQPIGGEFAFSPRLMDYWLAREWHENIRHYGVDIFMTCGALLGDFRVAQVVLGAKVHKPSAPKLGKMFTQVTDTLFSTLLESKENWLARNEFPESPPVFGQEEEVDPQGLSIDYKELKWRALEEFSLNRELITRILPGGALQTIETMFASGRLQISAFLWMRILHTFMSAYDGAEDREKQLCVVEALKPLYMARVVSFIRETLDLSHEESEEQITRQGQLFHRYRTALTHKLLQAAQPSEPGTSSSDSPQLG